MFTSHFEAYLASCQKLPKIDGQDQVLRILGSNIRSRPIWQKNLPPYLDQRCRGCILSIPSCWLRLYCILCTLAGILFTPTPLLPPCPLLRSLIAAQQSATLIPLAAVVAVDWPLPGHTSLKIKAARAALWWQLAPSYICHIPLIPPVLRLDVKKWLH